MRRLLDKKGPAAKLAAGLALALTLTAVASYAATRPGSGHGHERDAPASQAATPTAPIATPGSAALRITGHPPLISTRRTARFRVDAAGEPTLRCRLDRRAPKACAGDVVYRGLGPGAHTFYAQALHRGRMLAHASFAWTVLEPKPFTVEPRLAGIGPLYPGVAASPIPVVIANPNPVAITVTALRVTAGGGAAGCEPATNLALTAPALGAGLQIPAHGSVTLPSTAVAAPTVALRELDVDQDACKGASFNLAFSGNAGA